MAVRKYLNERELGTLIETHRPNGEATLCLHCAHSWPCMIYRMTREIIESRATHPPRPSASRPPTPREQKPL